MNPLIRSLYPFRTLAFLSVVLFATGCLTIEENYTFKKNGSGTMEYVVDMSAMAEMMKSLDTDGSMKSDGDGAAMGMEEQSKELKQLDGIKRVKLKQEEDGYLQRISFAFKDLTALNKALNVLMPDSTGARQTFFRWEGNTLVRVNNHHAKEMGGEMGSDADSTDLSGMLKSMTYKYSFKFRNKIAGVDVADGVKQQEPKAKRLELATDWSVIMKEPKALDFRITLDK